MVKWFARVLAATGVMLAAHCGGTTSAETPPNPSTSQSGDAGATTSKDGATTTTPPVVPPPEVHRPTALACPQTRAPVNPGAPSGTDAGFPGGCQTDGDCTNGTNGRCVNGRIEMCSYDECFADSDCEAGSVCHCGEIYEGTSVRPGHRCVRGDCRVDADCASGYCSPTLDPQCGSYTGITGYYCRTTKDTCSTDTACRAQQKNFCGYDPASGHWACSSAGCVG